MTGRLEGRRARRRGSALVLALIVVTIVAFLGAGFLRISTAVTGRQSGDVESMQAFYLAEAGLAEAFQAVRIGRTGQVGSETAPAAHGDGLLWVDATETADGHVRLQSTALCGKGRASLSLVVEPVEIPLGFFSDEDLVVDAVLLVDGFDSDIGTYEDQIVGEEMTLDPFWPSHVDEANKLVHQHARFYRYFERDGDTFFYDHVAGPISAAPDISLAFLFPYPLPPLPPPFPPLSFVDPFEGPLYDDVLAYFASIPVPAQVASGDVSSPLGPTTGANGLLASNGDVSFTLPSGDPVEIYGDVISGPNGSIDGLADVTVTGKTDGRADVVDLPEVEVPPVAMAAPVRHDGLLPMVVSAATSGHERIEVAADAELVLRGPATVVIGQLVLKPGALLTLDTRGGDVAIYVTQGMDLQVGSQVTTSGDFPDELTVQVGAIPTGMDGAPVKLDATSDFHGTIYAPETEVRVGTDFEVYGGIVARKLEIGAGARLHFDNAGFEGTPIPRVISWAVVEAPAAVRGLRGDPFAVLGVERGDLPQLADSHALEDVMLAVDYVSHAGVALSYYGTEEQFDWDLVADVVTVERDPERRKEDPGEAVPPAEPKPLEPIRTDVGDALETLTGGDLKKFLETRTPLNDAEALAMVAAEAMGTGDTKKILLDCGPLSEPVLTKVLGAPGKLDSSALKDVLLGSTPLPASVLGVVAAVPDTTLKASDKTAVLVANGSKLEIK